MTHDILFLLYAEDETGFRLGSMQLRNLIGSSSANCKDWPSYREPTGPDDRGLYSSIHIPSRASERDEINDYIDVGIAARVSSWSRSPSTRVTVTFWDIVDEDEDYTEWPEGRSNIF